MEQVPQYLLIGSGRVAKHFQHYFSLLNLSFMTWHRNQATLLLQQQLAQCSHILILISDHAIEAFISQYLTQTSALCIHFSGSHTSQHSYGAHPLMTFGEHCYDIERYQSIPFILDDDAPDFQTLLPGLANPHARLPKILKAKYHALCVLSGNFSCLLWQKLFHSFQHELNLTPSLAHAYLIQQTQNLLDDAKSAFTGPLIRNDTDTITKNLAALSDDAFQTVYASFVECYQQLKEITNHE